MPVKEKLTPYLLIDLTLLVAHSGMATKPKEILVNSSFDPSKICPVEICGKVENVTPLTLGMSGAAVYAVTAEKGKFVVRFHAHSPAVWSTSLANYRLAADCGVAPKLLHVDELEKAILTVQIEGPHFGSALMDPGKRSLVFASLVQNLRILQQQPYDLPAADDAVLAGRQIWLSQNQRPGFPLWALDFIKYIDKAGEVMKADRRRVFSHGDLNPANVLWDESRLWFVDWEVSKLDHPYMDLSTLSNFLSLPDAAVISMAAALDGTTAENFSAEKQQTLQALRNYSRVVYGALFLSLIKDLQTVDVNSTLTLSECFARFAAGKLSLTSDGGRAAIAGAFFRQVTGI